MGPVTQYALQVALLLCSVYLLYKWSLAGCTFSRFNRSVLLCLYAMAFLAVPAYAWLSTTSVDGDSMAIIMEELREEVAALSDSPAPTWPTVVSAVYLAGMSVAMALTIGSAWRIWRIICLGAKEKRDGYTLVLTDRQNVSPFSWGRYIVLPADTLQQDIDMILAHE